MSRRSLLKALGSVVAIALVGLFVLLTRIAGEVDEMVRDKYLWRARGREFGRDHTIASCLERALADAAECVSEKRERVGMSRAEWFVWGALREGSVQVIAARRRDCAELARQSSVAGEQLASLCRAV